ncbi:hypothetical protein KOR42_42960 [Thalassoglobus neptunius]|uniref:Preprotein translocase subunit SecG n=1 Tax=Thalassoglobus neptunius TaxID=1938619 RepID=A0A5C5WBF1_9PLAN|nr:hypothetical protein [Thalassoglobus neptunius]TWT46952.1 hypothetical protein KOR42_42960 [Thalassoglobus neptunius]
MNRFTMLTLSALMLALFVAADIAEAQGRTRSIAERRQRPGHGFWQRSSIPGQTTTRSSRTVTQPQQMIAPSRNFFWNRNYVITPNQNVRTRTIVTQPVKSQPVVTQPKATSPQVQKEVPQPKQSMVSNEQTKQKEGEPETIID